MSRHGQCAACGAHAEVFGPNEPPLADDALRCGQCWMVRAVSDGLMLNAARRAHAVAGDELEAVIEAAREATCDTHNIPTCVELGRALYEYDKARGALCPVCDGAGSIDDDECDRGEGPPCTGPCDGTGLIEPLRVTP